MLFLFPCDVFVESCIYVMYKVEWSRPSWGVSDQLGKGVLTYETLYSPDSSGCPNGVLSKEGIINQWPVSRTLIEYMNSLNGFFGMKPDIWPKWKSISPSPRFPSEIAGDFLAWLPFGGPGEGEVASTTKNKSCYIWLLQSHHGNHAISITSTFLWDNFSDEKTWDNCGPFLGGLTS